MNEISYFLLDVFTSEPFGGNPLAVVPDADGISTELMQRIAAELNLSETTFIQAPRNKTSDCAVRIFTPKSEVPMAGHPTIGTAYAILAERLLDPIGDRQLVFDEGVGPVCVDYELEGGEPRGLLMHQPLPQFGETLDRAVLAEALSLDETDFESELPVQVVSCGVPFILAPLRSLAAVKRAAVVRTDVLQSQLPDLDCAEVLVFSMETENAGSDVHCRMFAPRFGVPEDPATGGAHGPLGSYLFKHQVCDCEHFVSEQGFEMGRPSTLTVRIVAEGNQIADVIVGGDCVAMGQGWLRVP